MIKPQEKYEELFAKDEYPERLQQEYERMKDRLKEMEGEDLDDLIDGVYKEAYLDGFKDALFYMGH